MLYDIADAPEVMRWYRELVPALPEELSGWLALITIPPAPPFPEQLWGRKACAIVWCYTGPHDRADDILAPIREFGSPLVVGLHEMPFTALQSAFDPLYPAGLQWYWRADFFREITDAAIEVHREFGERLPTGHSTMHLYPIDGAAARVAPDATAFAYRDGGWAGVIVGVDPDPGQRRADLRMGAGVLGAAAPHVGGQRLPQLRDGRGHGPGARVLPRQLRAADPDQAPLRPGQHVPHQPEHPARRQRHPAAAAGIEHCRHVRHRGTALRRVHHDPGRGQPGRGRAVRRRSRRRGDAPDRRRRGLFRDRVPLGARRGRRQFTVRYFSPLAEVPFCGHATIATAIALAEREGPATLVLRTRSGPVTVPHAPERTARCWRR